MPKSKTPRSGVPTKQEIIDYLKARDSDAVRRDIARDFGVKGDDRRELRGLLAELEEEGAIEKHGRGSYGAANVIPKVAPIDVMSVDDDGDLLCMPTKWLGDEEPPMIRIPAGKAARERPPIGVGDRILARLKPVGDGGYEANIIKAIGKGAHRFLAVFRTSRQGGVAEPVERRARNKFTIGEKDTRGAQDGDLVWVETSTPRDVGRRASGGGTGRVREIAGHVDAPDAFSLIALAAHGIPMEMPEAAEAQADTAKLPPLGERTDLRSMPLLTIDPADARDHDDALFAAPDDDPENKGGFKVIVAIADVSFFVLPDSPLDREAIKRGNSVYLPDRVVPMLPERLSNDLCSLREGEDRPCLAVEIILDADGHKKSHKFIRALMRSAAKLSYEEAQEIIDGKAPDAPRDIGEVVATLHKAYKARMTERAKRAPLDLDLPERKIRLNKSGKVIAVERRVRFDAHKLVEEFMILANISAAETLEKARLPLIYRVHDTPDPERLDGVREYLASLNYSLVKGGSVRPSHFNQILKIAEQRDQKHMISEIVLRSQRQAVYSTDNLGHFGLNIPKYAHFTSPIRRYADLTVHRALVTAGKLGPGGQSEKERDDLVKIAQQISDLERRAIAAERESSDRYLSEFLADRIGAEFAARIRGVTKFGLFVMLEDTGADGFIPMRTIGGRERYDYVETRHAVVSQRSGAYYHLGQEVEVRLEEATPLTGSLRFDLLTEPLPRQKGQTRNKTGKTPPHKTKGKPGKKTRKPPTDKSRPRRQRS